MNMSVEELKSFLMNKGVEAKVFMFNEDTKTVERAAKKLGVERERVIKSMVLVDERGVPILAIITGDKNVDLEKVAKVCKVESVKIARPRAVKNITGYEAGAVPPVGHKKAIKTIIDPKVMVFSKVYGGGGEINALLEINPADILKLNNARIEKISTD